MRYFIAIDSGGTKTDSVLFDETGHIIKRSLTHGCNSMDIGLENAKSHLLSVIHDLTNSIPNKERLTALYSGVAATDYYNGELGKYVQSFYPGIPMRFEDDAVNLISGTVGHINACAIVCGTGSSLYARIDGKIIHLGGWGYLIDTGGSGYSLGRDALYESFRYCDGRGPKTLMYDLIKDKMGISPENNIPGIYSGGRPYIASLANVVFQARKMGDSIAERVFQKNVNSLAELTFAVEKWFDSSCYKCVLGGGIFSAFPEYADELKRQCSPFAELIRATVPPILGGVIEALYDGGIKCTDDIRKRFLEEYSFLAAKKE